MTPLAVLPTGKFILLLYNIRLFDLFGSLPYMGLAEKYKGLINFGVTANNSYLKLWKLMACFLCFVFEKILYLTTLPYVS